MYLVVNLLPPYLHIFRRFNPELNLAVPVAEYDYFDIVADDDGFVLLAAHMRSTAYVDPTKLKRATLN